MSQTVRCARGHTYEPTPGGPPRCPVCGDDPDATVAPPPVAPVADPNATVAPPESAGTLTVPGGATPRPAAGSPAGAAVVAGYEILGVLGRGAMGVVYKARQVRLNRPVALKMILGGGHAGGDERRRFQTEAEAVAAIQHPNIVQIYEVGESEGLPYFSMEFLPGGGLDALVRDRPPSFREAAVIAEKLARAMHAAHQLGVIHRDLKPANVLLSAAGEPKVTDFGLAKQVTIAPDGSAVGGGATQTGTAMGTPSYMAPEQADGRTRDIGPLSDVYSLGAILYELLTGRPPFRGESVVETMMLVMTAEPVSPSRLQPRLPRDLVTIALKALSKDPRKRYGSAAELADDLRRHLDGEPIRAVPAGSLERAVKWARRNPGPSALIGSGALGLAVLIALGTWFALSMRAKHLESLNRLVRLHVTQGMSLAERGELPLALLYLTRALSLEEVERADQGSAAEEARRVGVHRTRIRAARDQCPRMLRLWFHDSWATDAAFCPDGRLVASAGGDGTLALWDVVANAPVAKARFSAGVLDAQFSADGTRLLAADLDGTVRVFDAARLRPVCEVSAGGTLEAARLSADGRRALALTADGRIRLWEVPAGTATHTLAPPERATTAEFSPDGRRVVAACGKRARVWDADTGRESPHALAHAGAVTRAEFGPDGRTLLTAGRDRVARLWDADTGAVRRELVHSDAVELARLSPAGDRVASACADGSVTVWEAGTGRPVRVQAATVARVNDLEFSPAGDLLATAGDDNSARVWCARTGAPRGPELAHNGGVLRARFGPRGDTVLTASRAGTVRLYRRAVSFPGREVQPAPLPGPIRVRTADGTLEAANGPNRTLEVRRVATGELAGPPIPIADCYVFGVAFAPDGRRLAAFDDRGRVRVWDVATGAATSGQPLTHASSVYSAAWSADGTAIASASDDNTARTWDAATGELRQTFRHSSSVYRVALSPDAGRLLTLSAAGVARVWDAPSGEMLTPPLGLDPWVERVLDTPDDPAAWELPVSDEPIAELELVARWLSGREIDDAGNLNVIGTADLRGRWARFVESHPHLLRLDPEPAAGPAPTPGD